MRRIAGSIFAFVVVLSGLWLVTGWTSFNKPGFFGIRNGVIQWSGVVGIGLMTVAVILSARPRRLERLFDGLDKTYRLHKWTGIVAFVVCAFHWFMASGFKLLISAGIMSGGGGRPAGGRPGEGAPGQGRAMAEGGKR
jgi:predicted ferric reductase